MISENLHKIGGFEAGPAICPEYLSAGPQWVGNQSVVGKTEVSSLLTAGARSMVLLIMGQSNAVNIVADTSFTPSVGVQNFNFYNGKNYIAKDPLIGCQNAGGNVAGNIGGNFATRLGSKLIDSNITDRVVIANCAIGSTPIAAWAAGGELEYRSRFVIRAMLQAGLTPDYILMMQGESDTINGTTATNMTNGVRNLVHLCRMNGAHCPFILSLTSYVGGLTNAAVRQGQINATSMELGIHVGPDTDSLGAGYRQSDNLHFNVNGINAVADLWMNAIVGV